MQSLRNAIAPAERESPTRRDQLFAENMRFLFSSWIRWAGSATRARRTDSGARHAVSHDRCEAECRASSSGDARTSTCLMERLVFFFVKNANLHFFDAYDTNTTSHALLMG